MKNEEIAAKILTAPDRITAGWSKEALAERIELALVDKDQEFARVHQMYLDKDIERTKVQAERDQLQKDLLAQKRTSYHYETGRNDALEDNTQLRKELKTRHTQECLEYAANTGKPYCISKCADERRAILKGKPKKKEPCVPSHPHIKPCGSTPDDSICACGCDVTSWCYQNALERWNALGFVILHTWDKYHVLEPCDAEALRDLMKDEEKKTRLCPRCPYMQMQYKGEGGRKFWLCIKCEHTEVAV